VITRGHRVCAQTGTRQDALRGYHVLYRHAKPRDFGIISKRSSYFFARSGTRGDARLLHPPARNDDDASRVIEEKRVSIKEKTNIIHQDEPLLLLQSVRRRVLP